MDRGWTRMRRFGSRTFCTLAFRPHKAVLNCNFLPPTLYEPLDTTKLQLTTQTRGTLHGTAPEYA